MRRRGGLIAGASSIDTGGTSSFSDAWQAGWRKGWRLLGISILPAIPGFFLALVGLFSFASYVGAVSGAEAEAGSGSPAGLGGIMTVITCIATPMMILGLPRTFASRAHSVPTSVV